MSWSREMGLKMITGADYAKCIAIACFIEKSLPCCKTSYLIIYISYYIIYYVIYIYYITLHYIISYHIILYYIISYYIILYYIILYYIILYYTIEQPQLWKSPHCWLSPSDQLEPAIAKRHWFDPDGHGGVCTSGRERTNDSLEPLVVYSVYIYTYMNIFVRY
jgi:hypothetical protein